MHGSIEFGAKPQKRLQNVGAWLIVDRFKLVRGLRSNRRIRKSSSLSIPRSRLRSKQCKQCRPKSSVRNFGAFGRYRYNPTNPTCPTCSGHTWTMEKGGIAHQTRAIHRMTHKVASPWAFCRLDFLKSEVQSWRELSARISSSWPDYVFL